MMLCPIRGIRTGPVLALDTGQGRKKGRNPRPAHPEYNRLVAIFVWCLRTCFVLLPEPIVRVLNGFNVVVPIQKGLISAWTKKPSRTKIFEDPNCWTSGKEAHSLGLKGTIRQTAMFLRPLILHPTNHLVCSEDGRVARSIGFQSYTSTHVLFQLRTWAGTSASQFRILQDPPFLPVQTVGLKCRNALRGLLLDFVLPFFGADTEQ